MAAQKREEQDAAVRDRLLAEAAEQQQARRDAELASRQAAQRQLMQDVLLTQHRQRLESSLRL